MLQHSLRPIERVGLVALVPPPTNAISQRRELAAGKGEASRSADVALRLPVCERRLLLVVALPLRRAPCDREHVLAGISPSRGAARCRTRELCWPLS